MPAKAKKRNEKDLDEDIARVNSEIRHIDHNLGRKRRRKGLLEREAAVIDRSLDNLEKAEKHTRFSLNEKQFSRSFRQSGYLMMAVLAMILLGTFIVKTGMTGFAIGIDNFIAYRQSLDENITQSGNISWELSAHPDEFNLKGVRVSGYMRGEGAASIYLVAGDGTRYLVFDEDEVGPPTLAAVTASVINFPEEISESESAGEKTITTVLEYKTGTIWDPDDDGIAYGEDGVVDLTVENTQFSWEADESMLCTKWMVRSLDSHTDTTLCHGAAECCALSNVAPDAEEWDAPLNLFEGRYGATKRNTVIAQVIFINQSLDGAVYFESVVGAPEILNAYFTDKPRFNFTLSCIDTCVLPDGLNTTEYTLEVDLQQGVEIFLNNITYHVENLTVADVPVNETNETNETNQTVNIYPGVKDSHGRTIPTVVEFIDVDGKLKNSKAIDAQSRQEDRQVGLARGHYKVRVQFTNKSSPVKFIEINSLMVENGTGFINVDDVPETGELRKYVQVYAIDPTEANFTSAEVTVTAKGSMLYKCKEWDFDNRECDGTWVFLMSITPGENYTFTLTQDDPGFAELNGTFFEGWESGSLATNNWTTSGAGAAWTLVGYSQYQGSYTAQGDPQGAESIIETNIDTTGYADVHFSFYAQTSGLDTGEYIAADWYNGTGWTNVLPQTQNIGAYTPYNYSLGTAAANNTGFKIRFRCLASNPNERCFVDNVQVAGGVGDVTDPVINSINDAPDPVDQGQNVTITANVTDDVNVSSVWVGIEGTNHTMADESSSEATTLRADSCFDSQYNDGQNWESYGQFTISGSGTADLTKMWWYQPDSSFGSGEKLEMALYYPNGSMIQGTRINVSGTGSSGWTSATYTSPVEITLGQTFWIAYGPVSGTFNLPVDNFANCGSWLPNSGTYGVNPASGGLNPTAPAGSQVANRYFNPGVTYEVTTDAGYVYRHNTTGQSGIVSYTVYANDTSGNTATPQAGTYTVNGTAGSANLSINATVLDALGNPINVSITATNTTESIIYSDIGTYQILSVDSQTIYDITLQTTDHIIENITINDVVFTDNTTRLLDIDDPADNQGWDELYAINPIANFSNATVTVTAKGGILFKCADWNFSARSCGGEWSTWIKTTPGEQYTFMITPTDPGLAEGNGTFFEDWETGSTSTNNWTTSGITNGWQAVDYYVYAGTYTAQSMPGLSGQKDYMTNNFSTAGYANVTLQFWWRTLGFDASGDYYWVSYYNGTAWKNLTSKLGINDSYSKYSYSFGSDADNNPNFRIRFGCYPDANNERCFADNILINATPYAPDNSTPNVTAVLPALNSEYLVNGTVTISANVSDDTGISSVVANVTWGSGYLQQVTLTDPDTDGRYTGNFTNTNETGAYNVTIIATDTSSNVNSTEKTNFSTVLQAIVETEQPSYGSGSAVQVLGLRFTINGTVTLDILYPNSTSVSSYPKNVSVNAYGGITDSWTVPSGSPVGNYTITADDLNNTLLEDNTTFEVRNASVITITVDNRYGYDEFYSFNDNFDDGNSDGWTETGTATWTVAGGMYGFSTGTGYSSAGNSGWEDYSFSTTVRAETDMGLAEVSARVNQNTGARYHADLRFSANTIYLHKTSTWGSLGLFLNYTTMTLNPATDYNVTLVVNGSRIEVWVDGAKKVEAIDSTYTRGSIGIGGMSGYFRFDNASVSSIAGAGYPDTEISIYNSTGLLDHSCTSPCDYLMDFGRYKNIEILPAPEFELKKLTYYGLHNPVNTSYTITIDNPPETVPTASNIKSWTEVVAIGSSFQNFNKFEAVVEQHNGTGVYECTSWDMDSDTCSGDWIRVQSSVDRPRNTTILLDKTFLNTNVSLGIGDEIITFEREHFSYMAPQQQYVVHVTLYNQMDTPISGVTVTEKIPAEWFSPTRKGTVTSVGQNGSFAAATNTITWTVGTLSSKQKKTLDYTINSPKLTAQETSWWAYPFTANATYTYLGTGKYATDRDGITIKATAVPAFSLAPSSANASANYTYTFTISNRGAVPVQAGSTVMLKVPAVCTVSSISDSGSLDANNTITWQIGTQIGVGADKTRTFDSSCAYWSMISLRARLLGNDTNGWDVDSTQYLKLTLTDVNAPQINDITTSPLKAGINNTVTITAEVTDDLSVYNVWLKMNYPDSSSSNFTMSLYSGNTYRLLFTGTQLEGDYNYTIYAKDKAYNEQQSSLQTFNVSSDLEAPEWSGQSTLPTSGSAYDPTRRYQFNVTWTDETTVDSVTIQHNFTGALSNSTVTTYAGDEYYYDYLGLRPGSYAWKEYAEDVSGYANQTTQWAYTVAKADPTLALTLNGQAGNITINSSNAVQIIGTFAGAGNYSTLPALNVALVVWDIDDNTHPGGSSCGGAGSHMPWNSALKSRLETDGHNVTYVYHQDGNNDYYDYSAYDLIILEHFCAQENVDDIIAPGIDAGVKNSGKPVMFSAVYDNELDFTTTDSDVYTSGTTHFVWNDSHHISGLGEDGSEIYLYNNPGVGEVSITYMGSNVKSTAQKLVVENNDSTRTIIAAHKTLPRVFFGASNFDNLTSTGWELFERSVYWLVTRDSDSLELYEAGSIIDRSNSEANVTRSYSAGSYNITLRHPSTANYNTASVTYFITVQDQNPPTYSNITEPADPSTYTPGASYNFTIEWDDDFDISAVLLEFDGTNYTPSSNGSTYYRTFTLAAGVHNYRWYANDTGGLWNDTGTLTFTVNQAGSTCSLAFDKASPQTYGTQVNASCSCTTPGAAGTLWRNSNDVTATENNALITLPGGVWSYTCNSSGNQNYSGAINTSSFTIDKAASSVNLEINGTDGNLTIERASAAELDAARLAGEGPIQLYRNGTLLDSGSTILSHTATYSSESVYNITAYYPATQNYSASSKTHWLIVQDTIAPGPVTGLALSSKNDSWLYWIWNDPSDSDFAYTEVWLNGTHVANRTSESYSATGLQEYTYYRISLRTVDDWGTVSSTWVNSTQRTDPACTESWVAAYHDCQLNDTRVKYYTDTNSCGTTHTLPGDNGTVSACDCVVSTGFNGTSTNLTGNNLSNLQDVVLEVWPTGTVRFQEAVTITRCIDIDSNASIGEYYFSLDSEQLPELNKSANITIYNTNFTNPRIMIDGAVCPNTTCTMINSSGGQIVFNVTHFTNYSVEEAPYCGDGSCNGAESCSSCALDCGSCGAPGGGGGGGGGGGSDVQRPCVPNWLCYSWGACYNNQQTRECFDANACNNETDKPQTFRYCVAGCAERWACGDWGMCTEAGIQTRVCNDLARCKTETRKPATVQPCEYDFCNDGKRNNNETGIDCGGSCRPCTEQEIKDIEDESKRNLLTGEAITVHPYELPNPVYVMPLVLLLILLVAVIALHKANLSERMKKVLTAAHVLLILAIVFLVVLTFNVHEVTGEAVKDVVNKTGIPGAVLAIIVSVLLAGGVTYVTLSRGLPRLDGIEQYYNKSKYWAGFALQRLKWSPKKRSEKAEIEFRMPEKSAVQPEEKAKVKPKESTMFDSLAEEIDVVDDQIKDLQEKMKKRETGVKVSAEGVRSAAPAAVSETGKAAILSKESIDTLQPAAAKIRRIPAAKAEGVVTRKAEGVKTAPAKSVEVPPSAEPATPKNKMTSIFGTDDPLKVAEAILKRREKK